MAATYHVTRSHLIYGSCLPLALLLGYLLAEPLESSSLVVVAVVVSVLVTPLLMKWHHPALVFSWNSAFYLPFLRGAPELWIALAGVGGVLVLLNRCVNPKREPIFRGAITWSVVGIAAVVGLTALATGGIGARVLGSSSFGGRKYIYIFAAIIGYFVLVSQRIPRPRAALYAGLYFLSGATQFIGDLAYMGGEKFYAVYYLISPGTATGLASTDYGFSGSGMTRITGGVNIASAFCLFMLARYGLRGLLDLSRPWRLAVTAFFLVAGLFGGFRSYIGALILTFGIMFFLEGLHRTRHLLVILLLACACAVGLAGFAKELPLSVQRSLSFLPIEIDLAAQRSAEGSLQWRFEMWREVARDVPQYFFKGKGYVIDPGDMFMSDVNAARGYGLTSEWAIVTGEYHNGPLSVLIPFGIWGALAFGWFLFVAGRQLYWNCRYGDPQLGTINRALFACFLTRVVFLVFLVGGFAADLPYLICLVGLAISLNGGERAASGARGGVVGHELFNNGRASISL